MPDLQPNPYDEPHPPPQPYAQPLWLGHQAPQEQPWPGGLPPQRRGRGWMSFGVAVLVLSVLAGVAALGVMLIRQDTPRSSVADLAARDCLVSPDLPRGVPEVSAIEVVDCGDEHDAEVFATFLLSAAEVADFDLARAGASCVTKLADVGSSLSRLQADGLEVRPLVATGQPDEGDPVVCFVRHADGRHLSGSIVE